MSTITKAKRRTRSKTRKTRKYKKHGIMQVLDERERIINVNLSALRISLRDAGYPVKTIKSMYTWILTPKIDVKFLRILQKENWTIELDFVENSLCNNILYLMDMRKRPYTKRPRNKDFYISLQIKYAGLSRLPFYGKEYDENFEGLHASDKIGYGEIENHSKEDIK